jgi:hypothetical protein
MSKILWDQVGERRYETGVDHGVLYIPDNSGAYTEGYAWNGLTTVTESPSGAEASAQYADNIKYLNLVSAEEFGATVEAFTYPDEFGQCDGTGVSNGVRIGQQSRKQFGLSYRTLLGNDIDGTDHGYKLHLVYNALAAPSEKAYGTVNDSPSAIAFSWTLTTTPVAVPGFKPAAILTIPSDDVDAGALAALEDILYGTAGSDPRLPLPAEVLSLFAGTVTEVVPTAPAFNSGTHTITIPAVAGVEYRNAETGEVLAAGDVVITEDTVVRAYPTSGHTFPEVSDNDWFYDFV